MEWVSLPIGAIILVDSVAWACLHLLSGYVAWRLPAAAFEKDNGYTRLRRWEVDGSLYRKILHLHRWKRFLPEAGGFFPGGFSKKRLKGRQADYLRDFISETRRGELSHLMCILPAPAFFLWNPWNLGVCMVVYALAVNLPFIAVNRFNRGRLLRAWTTAARREVPRSASAEPRVLLTKALPRCEVSS